MRSSTSIDIAGQKFGDLTARGPVERTSSGALRWLLVCERCGGFTRRTVSELRRGHVQCTAVCKEEKLAESAFRDVYNAYVRNAKAVGREFSLTYEWCRDAFQKPCFYCSSPPLFGYRGRTKAAVNGLDRVDTRGGYTEGNVVTCCRFCNFAKGPRSRESFEAWLYRVRHNGQPQDVVVEFTARG